VVELTWPTPDKRRQKQRQAAQKKAEKAAAAPPPPARKKATDDMADLNPNVTPSATAMRINKR